VALYDQSPADLGAVSIRFPNIFVAGGKNLAFNRFIHYDFHQDFLTPSDSWSWSVDLDELSDVDITAITPRARVELYVDDLRQTVGFIDDIRIRSARGSGSIMTITGRDWLSPAVDGHVDPKVRLKPNMSILDVVQASFEPFGMKAVADDNTANRNAITGAKYGVRTTKTGRVKKSTLAHQLKPYPNEGAFAFASRVTQRAGLWIWPAADGETVIVGTPEYDQDPRYQLRHRLSDGGVHSNVQESDVVQSGKNQPRAIIATGFGGGGEYAKSTLKGGIFNPVIQSSDDSDVINAYPEIKFLGLPTSDVAFEPITEPGARILYLYDPESHTQSQLESFIYRELSLCMRQSLQARYTIEGHKLNGQAVAIDTIIDVDDDKSNLHTPLWVLGRQMTKDVGGGTRTVLDLIRRGSLIFGPQ
jgi:prophage tail gpP-like protein